MVPLKYGIGNSKAMMNPANMIEIICMTGALIMTATKNASRGGALKVNGSDVGGFGATPVWVDGKLTGALLGLAMCLQRNPRKICARLNPKSQPRRCLRESVEGQRSKVDGQVNQGPAV